MPKLSQITGDRIRHTRKMLGFDTLHFAYVIGVHGSTISRWELRGPEHLRIEPASLALLVALNSYLARIDKQPSKLEVFRTELLTEILTGGSLRAIHCLLRHYFEDK
ncbi:MAG TPA: hypothetical protein PK156_33735 [Polyangium sp.]|nr:hypothetical protein [Polyangium sp.]